MIYTLTSYGVFFLCHICDFCRRPQLSWKDESCLRVVTLATGNKCVGRDRIPEDGSVVHDSHAEVSHDLPPTAVDRAATKATLICLSTVLAPRTWYVIVPSDVPGMFQM